MDIGTGDGRAVLRLAASDPATLAIGVDADAASMAEASRRAAAPACKDGLPNALFLVAAAEAMPPELGAIADLVTVRFPWGSLLRGCVGQDSAVASGIASVLRRSGRLEVLLAPAARDALDAMPTTVATITAAVVDAFRPFELTPVEAREATETEVRASGSSWARRLSAGGYGRQHRDAGSTSRTVTFVRLRSSPP